MAELTIEQQRAIALARARRRRQEQPSPVTPQFAQPDEADKLMGAPATRFALGAASPFLGAAQLGAEAIGFGGVTDQLRRVEEMKRRGMTPAAELQRLEEGRANLARMPGYETTIARIDEDIARIKAEGASADPSQAGFDVAGLTGTVLSPAVLGAMKIPTAGSVLGRAGQGAAIGAAFGAASPVTTDEYWTTKGAQVGTGAALGGIIPPAMDAGKAVYRIGRNMLDPLLPGGASRGAGRIIDQALGPKRAAVEAELRKPSVIVPDSQPTAAEAAARAGSPELSALQRIAAEHRPSAYSDIAKAQEGARAAHIGSFGQDKAALLAAQSKRAAEAAKNYGAVADDIVHVSDDAITTLLKRPSMKAAIDRAKQLTQEQGATWGAQRTVRDMQNLKMALDDMVANPDTFGLGGAQASAIRDTGKKFVAWLATKSPKWDAARAAYAADSVPINQMQVGQELGKSLTKPIGEGERAAVFAGAMREAPRMIKRATGQPRFDELEDVLKPENLKKAKDVLADLARKVEADRLAPLGRARAAQAAQPFGLPATGPLHQSYMIFKTILGRVSKGINEKTLDTMADSLKLPTETLKVLQRVPDAQKQAAIDQIIAAKIGRGAIAAGAELSGGGMDR